MKYISWFILLFTLSSCTQQTDNIQQLKMQLDSMQDKLNEAYKPGFGNLMSSVQVHHNKLWFAGQHLNWELAAFEAHEIMEALEDIQQYLPERKESEMTGMIFPALDSVESAIQQKDPILFNSAYTLLTNTCNECHGKTGFGFNIVKIPDNPPFSNQHFSLQNER